MSARLRRTVRRRLDVARRDDRGMTLVELIVSGMISVILLALVGSLFIRTVQTQISVKAAAATTNDAKLAFDEMQNSIRLAVETEVRVSTAMGTPPGDGKGDVLVLKSRRTEGAVTERATWRCVAWYLAPDKKLHRLVVAPPPASGTSPMLVSAPSTWPVVATNVTPVPSKPAFLALDPDPDVSAWYPGSVGLALTFKSSSSKIPVDLESTIAPRRQLQLNGEIPGGVRCV